MSAKQTFFSWNCSLFNVAWSYLLHVVICWDAFKNTSRIPLMLHKPSRVPINLLLTLNITASAFTFMHKTSKSPFILHLWTMRRFRWGSSSCGLCSVTLVCVEYLVGALTGAFRYLPGRAFYSLTCPSFFMVIPFSLYSLRELEKDQSV